MFARMMHAAGAELLADADIIMPVPLHRRKLFKRRFNQAAVLVQRLSELTGLPADLLSLKRVRQTNSQVGLAQIERRANVDAAFAVNPRDATKIGGKTILLIDDVITTGATLNACTRVLLKAGAANVDCLAIAMVGGMTETS
jgi:ComF family protein